MLATRSTSSFIDWKECYPQLHHQLGVNYLVVRANLNIVGDAADTSLDMYCTQLEKMNVAPMCVYPNMSVLQRLVRTQVSFNRSNLPPGVPATQYLHIGSPLQ